MYRLSHLQAVEPDALPRDGAVLVEVDPDPDSMGFPRVDLVADSREAIIEYAREHWGEEDPQWFAEYVVGRITEPPIAFDVYVGERPRPRCPGCGRAIKRSAHPDWLNASRWCYRCGGTAQHEAI